VKDHEARTVIIPAVAVEVVEPYVKQIDKSSLIFPARNGSPLRARNWRRDALGPAVVRAHVTPITPQNLRDTAASLAIKAGASVVAVARLLGHESPSTTLKHYAGLFPDDLESVAARLDEEARAAIDGDARAGAYRRDTDGDGFGVKS
jgi:integrase